MIDVAAALEHRRRRSAHRLLLHAALAARASAAGLRGVRRGIQGVLARPPRRVVDHDLRAMGEQRRVGPPQVEIPPVGDPGRRISVGDALLPSGGTCRGDDRQRSRGFARERLRRLHRRGTRRGASERSHCCRGTPDGAARRRWTLGPRSRDRSAARRARATGGTAASCSCCRRATRALKRRPLVMICDVSGSMERYATDAAALRPRRVEARWTRRDVSLCDPADAGDARTEAAERQHAMRRIPWRLPDWGGGTRIGDALRTFNTRWARRVMGHGPVVLVISDGWDRGEPDVLRREMARLQRSAAG